MNKSKKEIAKLMKLLLVPFVNIALVLIVSIAFAMPNESVISNGGEGESEMTKNERMVTVFFHKEDKVKEMKLEEYLLGVVPAEMPPSFNTEALKAQAVAARTFIINREKADNKDTHKGATVCTDSTHCKAYITEEEALKKWGDDWKNQYKDKIKNVVYDTSGTIVTYNDEPISAVFHSTSSGKTENSEDVWQTALPYLRSVVSEGEEKSPRYNSNVTLSFDEFKNKFKEKYPDAKFNDKKSDWIKNIKYNDTGSVKTIDIGGITVKGTDVRTIFSLRSTNFKIEIDDNVEFSVIGNGHGVGMSQYGANYAAENGYSYDKILKKYYQGVELKKIY